MVDHIAMLNANMNILIAAVANLTAAVNNHIHVCEVALLNKLEIPDSPPTEALSELLLTPSPPSTPSIAEASESTGDSPDVVREHLAAMAGTAKARGAWYIVTVGQEPGVYQHIAEVSHLTSGISGNAYKRYSSQASAIDAYERAWNLGAVRRVR